MITGIYKGHMKDKSPEILNVNLISNQNIDLTGTEVYINVGSTQEVFIWNNKTISVKIPEKIAYSISFGSVEYFNTPSQVHFVAIVDNIRDVVAEYTSEKLTINVTGEEGLIVSDQTVTVINDDSDEILYQSTVNDIVDIYIPYGITYTVSVNDYIYESELPVNTPASVTIISGNVDNTVDIYYETYKGPIINVVIDGNWVEQEDGTRKSPTVAANGINKETIYFRSTIDNVKIIISMRTSSETNYDFGLVGLLDSTALTRTGSYTNRVSGSSTTPTQISVSVPTAGDHFVQVGYGKDGSGNSGSDCCWYSIVEQTIN